MKTTYKLDKQMDRIREWKTGRGRDSTQKIEGNFSNGNRLNGKSVTSWFFTTDTTTERMQRY